MTTEEKAQRLLDKAARVMSGMEMELCRQVASGMSPDGCDEWDRLETEFAAYLK